MFLALIPAEGGFPTRVWYPASLFLLGLAVLLAVAQGRLPLPVTRSSVVAVAAFAAFTVWSFLSIAWADVSGLAWEGSNRTLLFLLAFALFAALPLTARGAMTVLSVFVVGTAAVGLLELALGLGDAESVFLGGRFAVPTDYANANAAFYLIALWPALVLSTETALPAPLRGLLVGVAGVLAELALVCQSRGSVVAAGLTALVVVALAPDRIRLLAAMGIVGGAVALAAPGLLDATNEVVAGGGDLPAVIRRLLETLLVTLGALAVVGSVLAHVDRRIDEGTRRVRLIVLGAAGAVAVAILAAGIATGNSPRAVLAGARDDVEAELRTSRYGSSGSQSRRGEHWRVAFGEFRRRPVEGMGVDNFGVAYIRERQDDLEEPLHPHSLLVRIVTQTGLVGTTLFAVFLLSALSAALRRRPPGGTTRIAVVAAVAPFVYWFIHGAADWLWEFPGLSLPALGFLALAGAVGRGQVDDDGRPRTGRATARLGVAAAVAAAVLAFCSLAASWLSVRELEAGLATWRSAPSEADAHFDRARRLNPLTDAPDVAAGVVAGRRGRLAEMRRAFERALERNPSSWYSHLELALVDAAEGRRAAALAQLRTARALNPTEQVLIDVERKVRAGEAVSIREIDAIFAERVESLVR
jgi:O-antigen ligase